MWVKLCFLRNEAAKSLIYSRRTRQFMSDDPAGASAAGMQFSGLSENPREKSPGLDGG